MDSGLTVSGLSYSYSEKISDLVFEDVSFKVPHGRILGVFGPNGCGKSTVLSSIAGLLNPTGAVNYPLTGVALVPQDYQRSFLSWTSLRKNLDWSCPAKSRREISVDELCRIFGFELDLTLKPNSCSGGMLQQAAILRAFYSEATVILADEPFSALDTSAAASAKAAMVKLCHELDLAIVVVLHDVEDLVEVCDEAMVVPSRPFTTNPNLYFANVEFVTNRAKQITNRDLLTPVDLARFYLKGRANDADQ